MKAHWIRLPASLILLVILSAAASWRAEGQTIQVIYADGLSNNWVNYSWATVNLAVTSPVHSGSDSISVACTNYEALYLHHNNAFNSSPYTNITFWIYALTSGVPPLKLQGTLNGTPTSTNYQLPSLTASTWTQISVPLTTLGVANVTNLDGFWLQSSTSSTIPTFYVDDISLVGGTAPSVTLTSPTNGLLLAAPATLSLAATVSANGQTINFVQFFNGTNILAQQTNAPYSFAWTNVAAGNYNITAVVTYNGTNQVVSSVATVSVVSIAITVDAHLNQHAISPQIYGTAFATSNELSDLNFTMNRSGGNEETTYNWTINAHGKGADYYFESIPDSSSTPGESADSVVANSVAGGARTLITIPIIGWSPILGANRAILPSFSIAKYGPQTAYDPYFTNAGNGVSITNNTLITWNNPTDAYVAVTTNFQQAYVHHLITNWGVSTNGGVGYYIMDNEHSLWSSTHQDIHPIGPTMQEIFGKIVAYSSMVKSQDPNALVLGPEEWGWPGYFYSGYDQQWSGLNNNYNVSQYPDRATNGGMDYMPWLLNQLHQYQITNGARLLDYFTLHCYPQEGNVGTDDVDPATEILRNQSTRQFWDTNYVDPSWINSVIDLIPRMQSWVATYYPGTKVGITEYNWGAEPSISGATAQADILGIFGRQSLDLATRWTTPDPSTPTYLAMKIYRNYDGNHSTFGDTSVSATGPNPDNVAVFGATRSSDGALTVMIVSKMLNGPTPFTLTVTNFTSAGVAHVWQLNSSNVIARLSDVSLNSGVISTTVPGQSVTLLVLPPKPVATLLPGPPRTDGQFQFSLSGITGQTWILQFSTNLATWLPVMTNTLTNTSLNFLVPRSASHGFYRALASP